MISSNLWAPVQYARRPLVIFAALELTSIVQFDDLLGLDFYSRMYVILYRKGAESEDF